jgi:hypothetical protein
MHVFIERDRRVNDRIARSDNLSASCLGHVTPSIYHKVPKIFRSPILSWRDICPNDAIVERIILAKMRTQDFRVSIGLYAFTATAAGAVAVVLIGMVLLTYCTLP